MDKSWTLHVFKWKHDSKVYTNFEFCKQFNNKNFMLKKTISRKNMRVFEDDASGVQVGDIKEVIVEVMLWIQ